MRRMGIILTVLAALVACLARQDLPSTRRDVPSPRAPAALDDVSLRDLIPASALLAAEVRGIGGRWAEIRDTRALADFMDSILFCLGIEPELIPGLSGESTVIFLASLDGRSWAAPVMILRPVDMDDAQELFSALAGPSCARGHNALWVGPAGTERLLERFAQHDGAKLGDILPLEEDESSLPRGGLVRGWVNPGSCVEVLRDSSIGACPAPPRWAAPVLRADLAAVCYAEFKLVSG